MSGKNASSKRQKHKEHRKRLALQGSPVPRPFEANLRTGHRFRFVNGVNNGTFTITITDLLDLLCVATTATAAFRLLDAVKLKRVEVWSRPYDVTFPGETISLQKAGSLLGASGDSKKMSDTCQSASKPAHVIARWSEKEQTGQWQGASSTGALFQLYLPPQCTIDVSLSCKFAEGDSAPVAVTGTVSGATVGRMYVRTLGSTTGSNLQAVAVATI